MKLAVNRLLSPSRRFPCLVSLCFTLFILLTGCAALMGNLQQPVITFAGLQIADATLVDGTMVFNFTVRNPNAFGLRASRITYDLKLNGRHFARGQTKSGLSLPAQKVVRLQIPVAANYLEAFGSLLEMNRRGSAAYDLSGKVSVGPLTLPYRSRGTFDLPRMPKLHLEAIHVNHISLAGATVTCDLNVENPNNFDLSFKKLHYDLELGGMPFAKASAEPASAVTAKGKGIIALRFEVSFVHVGGSAHQLLMHNQTDYRIQGRIALDATHAGERLIPFNFGGKVPIVR